MGIAYCRGSNTKPPVEGAASLKGGRSWRDNFFLGYRVEVFSQCARSRIYHFTPAVGRIKRRLMESRAVGRAYYSHCGEMFGGNCDISDNRLSLARWAERALCVVPRPDGLAPKGPVRIYIGYCRYKCGVPWDIGTISQGTLTPIRADSSTMHNGSGVLSAWAPKYA